jgi:tape measure domain-containing protein
MADVTKTVAIIFQGQDNTTAAIRSIETSLQGVSSAAGSAAPNLDATATSADRLGGTAISVRELASAMQLLAGSVVVKEFIDANVAVENFGRAMTLVSGSTQGAADALDFVRKTSNTLGLEISSTSQNFVNLAAAAKGTTLEGQATRDIFEAVSKAMSLLGKSSADTEGVLIAISQIISKGTVASEELRGQLGERLPGAFQIAARAIGVTTAELGKLLEGGNVVATEFLPAFTAELNRTFGDTTYVATFSAELNRLINSFKDLAVAGGDAGLFGALTGAIEDVRKVTQTTAIEFNYLSTVFGATRNFLLTGGEDWEGYKAAIRGAGIEAGIAGSEITNSNESLAETARLARAAVPDLVDYSKAVNESAAETRRLGLDGTEQTAALVDAYKKLGFTAKSIGADFVGAFETIVKSAESTGDEISKALKVVIPKIDGSNELERVVLGLQKAAEDGKITWERYGVEVDKASEAFLKNTGYVKESSAEIKKQADEVKKAEENAAKLALELEKLASNERIKALEFRAEVNVAQIEADAQKVIAAFESISTSITSTENVLGDLFGLFDSLGSLDSSARNAIFEQIDKENDLRAQSFELQKKLTEAQIENITAQTRQLESGDALIKIEASGLEPALEMILWEILKKIQTRVNRDGLRLLLGV